MTLWIVGSPSGNCRSEGAVALVSERSVEPNGSRHWCQRVRQCVERRRVDLQIPHASSPPRG